MSGSNQPSADPGTDQDSNAARKYWMSVLARSSAAELGAFLGDLDAAPSWTILRKPETGLVMVRGRAGGQGQRFNLGETTITRCSISLDNGVVGHSWIRGRNKQHAELAAVFDALMQDSGRMPGLQQIVIDPIANRLAVTRKNRAEKVAKTKVDFYTMVRGED